MQEKVYNKVYITLAERKKIEELIKVGVPVTAISSMIGKSVWSVRYELKKNGGKNSYTAEDAQKRLQNNLGRRKTPEFSQEEKNEILRLRSLGISRLSISMKLHVGLKRLREFIDQNGEEILTNRSPLRSNSVALSKLDDRISNLEMQLEVLAETLKNR